MVEYNEKTIVVAGATGKQGGSVVRSLLLKGWRVIGLTRDPNKPEAQALRDLGCEVARCDLDDRATLDQILPGVYGVFSVQTWWEDGIEGEIRRGRILADAAKAAKVRHFIYSSVAGADLNTGIPHFESKFQVEQYVRWSGLPSTIIRPVMFMDNFDGAQLRDSILDGRLRMPIRPERSIPFVAVDDIGSFCALVFDNPVKCFGETYTLSGEELTMTRVAEWFSWILGRTVVYEQTPIEEVRRYNPELATMFQWFDEHGLPVDSTEARTLYPHFMTFETWLRVHGWHELGVQKSLEHATVPMI